MPSLPRLLSTLLLSATPLVTACIEMDERAQNGCPVGETCSPFSPLGLSFSGAATSDDLFGLDDALYPIAVGGTQRVTMINESTSQALVWPWVASTDVAGVTAAQSDRSEVTITAGAAGAGRLRIDDRDGLLMDRIAIEAAPIASVALTQLPFGDNLTTPRPFKLWTGQRQQLVVALRDAAGRRLVDESARIRLTGPGTGFSQSGWDGLSLDAVPAGATSTTFEIVVGGVAHPVSIDAVDTADAIAAQSISATDIEAGDLVDVCFDARSGEAHVLGAPWQFTVSGTGELQPDNWFQRVNNCATVQNTTVGTVTVTATAGALSATTSFTVAPRNRRAPAPISAATASPRSARR